MLRHLYTHLIAIHDPERLRALRVFVTLLLAAAWAGVLAHR